jgi:hypothetical protein
MNASLLIIPLLLFGAAGRTREIGSTKRKPRQRLGQLAGPRLSGARRGVGSPATVPGHSEGSWGLALIKRLGNVWRRDVKGRQDHQSPEPDAEA